MCGAPQLYLKCFGALHSWSHCVLGTPGPGMRCSRHAHVIVRWLPLQLLVCFLWKTYEIAKEATSRSHVHDENIAYPAQACLTHNGTKNGGPRSTLNIVVAPHTCMPFHCYSIENNEQLRRKPPHDHMCMVRKSHTQLRRAQHTMGPRKGGPEAL